MKFSFFEALTEEEAKRYLDDFLEFGENHGIQLLEKTVHFTVDLDFSLQSLSTVLRTLVPVLKTTPRELDLSLPDFIRNTDSYKKNLFDFDETSKPVVLAVAYYLGKTFSKNFEQLSWRPEKVITPDKTCR